MRHGKDIAIKLPGLFIVHHNLPGSIVPSHAHPEHHLIIPLQGEISVHLDDRVMSCGPGRMVYVSPNIKHSFHSAREKGERLICMIDANSWKKAEAGDFQPSVVPASQLSKEILFYLLLNQSSKTTPALIEAFVRTIADILSVPVANISSTLDHLESGMVRPELRKAVAYARAHFAEELSVSELARKSGLSVRSLSRLCQVDLGYSPKQLLTALRIDKAKEHLLHGEMTVTETAFAVGYSSLSQFILSFRQLTGILPSEFARTSNFGRK